MNDRQVIRDFYNAGVAYEWNRIAERPEFLITSRILTRHIRPGMRVLDIGGGPGRYALHFAAMGCDVTLVDLADGNVAFAQEQAARLGLPLRAMQGDAMDVDRLLVGEQFDAVLLMGPLYHLLAESERRQATGAALSLLKPDGIFAAAFITMFSSMIDYMSRYPEAIMFSSPAERVFRERFAAGLDYAGDAFTRAYFIQPKQIAPFFAEFPLTEIGIYAQEGILSPCWDKIAVQSPEVQAAWLDFAETLADDPAYYSWAEHLLYIGQKSTSTDTTEVQP